ncbi:myelin-oligodendrocyte glycoprotein-like [Tachysurus fulvidraco]|uniref:myelin-oligodendrocyte glycoprotein-like n=1 Tax=Tachysurus fulvidraco TaxID=1234273 RepID=UPI001FED947D|nr:myelin-oligodendrocyte glycoprotein-like [Tachysurus fulvidraco]
MGTVLKMYFFFLLIVFICDGFKVHGPPGPLIVQLGDSVMLPCFVETPLPLEDLEVDWKRKDSEIIVHWWQNGESQPKSQNQRYHERAHFFTEEIAHGNFSLLLTDVTSKDAGVYKCAVYTKLDSGETLIEIKEIGLSFLHIAILILCILGVVIGSLILGSLSYTSYKKEEDSSRRALAIQCAHVLCPNITMSIVFILWGFTDGYFTEAATCSALNFARILFLLWIALDLKTFPDFPKRLITNLAILLQYTVITVAAYSSIFVDIYYRYSTEMKVALIIVLLLLLIPLLGLIAVVCCKRTTVISPYRIYRITELSDILRISFFTLGLQRSAIGALFPLFIVALFYFREFFTFLSKYII